ncbi:hypothetical protein HV466_19280 [Bacillus sporothermodurans]|nr:hypothetical protein [Heyndrickxia sporothermodurans]
MDLIEVMWLWVRKEEKRSDGKGTREAMGPERRKAVRWKRNTCGYGSGKKKSGPMEKEHVWLWVWKEEKRSDGKGTRMAMGPEREERSDGEGTRVSMGLERRKAVRWKRNMYGNGSGKRSSGPMGRKNG